MKLSIDKIYTEAARMKAEGRDHEYTLRAINRMWHLLKSRKWTHHTAAAIAFWTFFKRNGETK